MVGSDGSLFPTTAAVAVAVAPAAAVPVAGAQSTAVPCLPLQSPSQPVVTYTVTSVASRPQRASALPPGSWCNLTWQGYSAIAAYSRIGQANGTQHPPPLVDAQPVYVNAYPAASMSAAASSQLGTKQPAAKAQRFPKRVHKQPSQPQTPFVRPTIYSTENPAPEVNEAHLSITHGDCVEGMKLLANASVDLVIADPPYDIGVGKAVWDTVPHYMQWSRTWLAEAVRVLKPGGALMLYGSPERLWICHLKIMCADEFGLEFKQHISWVYKQGGDSRMNNMVKYAVRMEHLEWFVKPGAGHTFNLDAGTEAYSEAEFKEALAKGVGRVTAESLSRGKPPKNWWDIPRENSRSKEREYGSHPSMKPLRICDRIVGIHSNVGDTVLVPFGGSGSECVAVGAAGRKLVAYEQEAEYHRIIVRRMKGWGLLSGPPTPPPLEPSAAAAGEMKESEAEESEGLPRAARLLPPTLPIPPPTGALADALPAIGGAAAIGPPAPPVSPGPSAFPAQPLAQPPSAVPAHSLAAGSILAALTATQPQPFLLASHKRPRPDEPLGTALRLGLPVVMAGGLASPMHVALPLATPLVTLAPPGQPGPPAPGDPSDRMHLY